MPSEAAKRALGTFVPDQTSKLPVLAWLTQECRRGVFAVPVRQFCEAQEERLEQSSVIVESITNDCIHCRVPLRLFDHEADGAFDFEVRFTLNPESGECRRV